jgi:hypothetical protein
MSNGVVVGALLLVAADMEIAMAGAPIGEPVDQHRVAVVGEYHRPVGRENGVEFRVR